MNYFLKKIFILGATIVGTWAFFAFTFPQNWTGGFSRKTLLSAVDLKISHPQESISTPFDSSFSISKPDIPERTCNISDYGAKGDAKTDNTRVFWKAINDCAEKGGGHVVVPAGVFLSGPIELLSNIDLRLEKNSKILFTTDLSAYYPMVFSRFEGIEYYNYSPPIYARNVQNISLTGSGTIDGQGDKIWWEFSSHSIKNLYKMGNAGVPVEDRVFGTVADGLRPTFVEFVNCQTILIDGITLIKGPMWTIHPIYSQDIIVKNARVLTSPGPSTDGMAIDSSKNVLVDGVTFSTGDDAVVLKSGRDADGRRVGIPTQNVVIRNSHIIDAHGAVAIGSEMSGGVKNVLAQNLIVDDAQYGFRVKSNSNRGGTIQNIWVENFKIDGLSKAAVQFNMYYERRDIKTDKYPPTFQNINVSDFSCHNSSDSVNFFGLPGHLKDINLKNIFILKSRDGLRMEDAQNVSLDNINLHPKHDPVFELSNPQDLILSNSSCPDFSETCVSLSGKNTRNIHLLGERKNFPPEKIQLGSEIDKNQISIDIQ